MLFYKSSKKVVRFTNHLANRGISWHRWALFGYVHIFPWYTLVNALSYAATQQILVDMMHHFLDGSGTDYSHALLTEKVAKHESTIAYMEDFTKVFNEFVFDYQGNITAFANSESFKKELRNNNVYFTAYDYWGKDILGGLTMAIHGWTESQVNLSSFKINADNTYSGTLQFAFKDNFGLDVDDIKEFGALAGFRSWFVLQHYEEYNDKYKPFKTVVTVDYPIYGNLTSSGFQSQ